MHTYTMRRVALGERRPVCLGNVRTGAARHVRLRHALTIGMEVVDEVSEILVFLMQAEQLRCRHIALRRHLCLHAWLVVCAHVCVHVCARACACLLWLAALCDGTSWSSPQHDQLSGQGASSPAATCRSLCPSCSCAQACAGACAVRSWPTMGSCVVMSVLLALSARRRASLTSCDALSGVAPERALAARPSSCTLALSWAMS